MNVLLSSFQIMNLEEIVRRSDNKNVVDSIVVTGIKILKDFFVGIYRNKTIAD